MLRKRGLWISLVVIFLVAGAGYAYYARVYLPTLVTPEPTIQTATARRGDLVIAISGIGKVIPADEIDLGFRSGGILTELLVFVGEAVEAGQLLAKLDDSTAAIHVAQAEINLRELTSPAAIATAQQGVAQAQLTVAEAEDDLSLLISPLAFKWEQRLDEAQQTVEAAQAEAGGDASSEAQDRLAEAEAAIEEAQANLTISQRRYLSEYIPENFTFSYRDQDTREIIEYLDPPTDVEIAEARAALALAVARLDEAKALVAALTGMELPLDAAGPGLAKLEGAQLSVRAAQLDLEALRLVAPISGTVASISANVGESVSPAPIITLTGLDHPTLEIFLDETELGHVKLGSEVEIILDTEPDKTLIGHLVGIDPAITRVENVPTVRGIVVLDDTQGVQPASFLVGQNATVDVIAGKVEDAILVPIEALRELAPGEYAVFVMEDGQPKLRVVEVGLMDFAFAEIKTGVMPGDVVTTGIVETE